MDPVKRFSNRADNYAKYRPSYPAGVVDVLKSECDLDESSKIADVGSGTGLLSELFLKNGNSVIGIEPNAAMRLAAERLLASYSAFISLDATAEKTKLENESVDIVAAAQAFHWFDREKAKREFARILKPGGWVVLIWNERRLDTTAFLRDYEELLLRFGTDYEKVRHENVAGEIAEFFSPNKFELRNLENFQRFDLESLTGRVLSSSYTPEPDQPNFAALLEKLEKIFETHQHDGIVSFEYDTTVYFGHLTPIASLLET